MQKGSEEYRKAGMELKQLAADIKGRMAAAKAKQQQGAQRRGKNYSRDDGSATGTR